jgi:hypothetical protein
MEMEGIAAVPDTEWTLPVGTVLLRKDLHDTYGGRRQGGISPSRESPNVFVFSDLNVGEEHGYIYDAWDADVPGLFHYTGEGQRGDQRMVSGNRAIRDHSDEGRALRVFKGVRGEVRYLGEFNLARPGFDFRPAHESGGQAIRRVIVFHLKALDLSPDTMATSRVPLRRYQEAKPSPTTVGDPWQRDPNTLDRSLKAHADTQNGLQSFLANHGVRAWSPDASEPDFDLGWLRGRRYYVCEVKSLPTTHSEDRQLRLGIGQVLDYQALLSRQHPDVRAVLAVERRPSDPRWSKLAEAHGITIAWPDTICVMLDKKLFKTPGRAT